MHHSPYPLRSLSCWLIALGLAAELAPLPANGAAIKLNTVGARARGMGGAFTALADDATAAHHNPAGLTDVTAKEVQLGLGLKWLSAEYDPVNNPTESNDVHTLVIPGVGAAMPLSEKVHIGFLTYVPYGLQLDWDDNAAHRYNVTYDELKVVNGGVAVSRKVSDTFSVGAAVFLGRAELTLERKVPNPGPPPPDLSFDADGDDNSHAFHLGCLWRPAPNWRVGATYRSQQRLSLEGEANLSNGGSDRWSMDLDLPRSVSLGSAWQINDDWLVSLQADWVDWSSIKSQDMVFSTGALPMDRDWDDRWQYRLGVERRLTDCWDVRFGYSYDPSPVPSHTLDPMIMDIERHILSLGVGFQAGPWTLDAAYERTFALDDKTASNSFHTFPTNGEYNGHIDTIGLSCTYRFQ